MRDATATICSEPLLAAEQACCEYKETWLRTADELFGWMLVGGALFRAPSARITGTSERLFVVLDQAAFLPGVAGRRQGTVGEPGPGGYGQEFGRGTADRAVA